MAIRGKAYSPLRYPGGKAVLADFLRSIIRSNNIENCTYFEMYAGGAGAALNLLFTETVNSIVLNDADYHIYIFWKTILNETDRFINSILNCDISIDEWSIQREIYDNPENHDDFSIAFSTFFLNRCNRSGILSNAGPIGGMSQSGNYKINARFNKIELIKRIERISERKNSIEIYNLDSISFINNNIERLSAHNSFAYLDPPYYKKGKSLYLNFYSPDDHKELRDILQVNRNLKWVISYDNVEQIRDLYMNFNNSEINVPYSLQLKRMVSEFFAFSDNIELPNN